LDDDFRKALAAGDAAAVVRVYDQHGPAMFRVAYRLVGRRHDAEDIVSEVFAAMVRHRERLVAVTDVKAYLFTSLRHVAGRVLRSRRRQAVAGLDESCLSAADASRASAVADGPGDVLEHVEGTEETERLWRMVGQLPEEQRDVLTLKIQGGLSFKEIGAVCGISANTAASRYRYALEKLQRMAEKLR